MNVSLHLQEQADADRFGVPFGPVKKKKKHGLAEAIEIEQGGDHKEAEKRYIQLMDENFDNYALIGALGMNQAVQGKHGLAHHLLGAALARVDSVVDDLVKLGIKVESTPEGREKYTRQKKAELMNAIGTTYKNENKIEQARHWFHRAKETLKDPCPDIDNNIGTLYINEGDPQTALKHLNEALRLKPDHGQARWNASLAHLELGNYALGFDEYHWGVEAGVRCTRHFDPKKSIPEWDGTPGKTVVVYGEQGIGDEIMFASILPDMMRDCKKVVFECHGKLHRLFSSSFPELDIYGTREDVQLAWPIRGDGTWRYPFDARISIGDAMRFYRRKLEDFPGTPYIYPTKEAAIRWAKKLNGVFTDTKLVVGINWIGGHKKTRKEVRSLTLEQMLPILKQDAHFVSLQYTECSEEIAEFEAKHGIKIHNWPEASMNPQYDETGGLVANLDMIITNCSSIVHLGGAMGVPTWVMTPSRPAWRYRLDLDYMPWYGKSVRLFRQAKGSIDWTPVVDDVAEQVAMVIANKPVPVIEQDGPLPDYKRGLEIIEDQS